MSRRKTVNVQWVVGKANSFLLLSDETQKETRVGVAALLESILHETDNYCGFQFLPSEIENDGHLRKNADESRRRYF